MIQLGWTRRDAEGKKVEILFELVRDKATWKVHRTRHDPREDYTPDAEDWEALLEAATRHAARGKVTAPDLAIVKRLRAEAEGT